MATSPLTLMAVHAHPDDEAVGTGGTLALYAARGVRTVLVTCTRGEEGEIVDDQLKAEIADSAPTPEDAKLRLALVRDKELAAAVEALHITQFYQLGYRDSGMAGTESNADPRAFTNVNVADATARVIELVRRERPQVMVTYDEVGGYGHPDHIMAQRIARLAFMGAANTDVYPQQSDETPPWQPMKFYEIAFSRDHMRQMALAAQAAGIEIGLGSQVLKQEEAILRGEPVDPEHPERPPFGSPSYAITTTIDIRPTLADKRASMLVHKTQAVSTNRMMGNLPDEMAEQAFGQEWFTLVYSTVPASRPETDLFAGIATE
jgi:N-acetyl-1-D-myo-inositol-2-amino-2-deoxy-alpha-D-glucopyranoside deacetylase